MCLAVTAFALSTLAGAAPGVAGASTARTDAAPPVNTSPPTVTGSAQQGQTLTASTGSWSGDAPISYTFTWQRCSGSGGSCADITGATAQTYPVTSSDVGSTLRIVVAAANSAGSSSAASSPTGTVAAADTPPSVTTQPDPHGTAQVGQTLTVDNGSWKGTTPLTYTYQWQRCTSSGTCTNISGATKSSYVPVAADVGYRLRATVTAKNDAGSASTASNLTAAVAAVETPPSVTKQPDPHGTAQVGQTLTVDNGGWKGTTPLTYTYQWQRCTSSGTCTSISGATKSSYAPVAADVGYRLRATVTAKNSAGSASTASNATAAVFQAVVPVNLTRPSISVPSARVGSTVVGSIGSWSGTSPISYSLTWERCDSSGGHCQTIAGASAQTYKLTSADAGSTLELVVKGSNSAGSSVVVSARTPVVTSDPPGAIRLPGGKLSIPASSVSAPNRIAISAVAFSRHPIRTRRPFAARIRVTDTRGYLVRDARVRVMGIPSGWVANASEVATGAGGYAVVTLRPTPKLPLGKGNTLVLYIRARKPGDSFLSSVSAHRLVQVQLGAPR